MFIISNLNGKIKYFLKKKPKILRKNHKNMLDERFFYAYNGKETERSMI